MQTEFSLFAHPRGRACVASVVLSSLAGIAVAQGFPNIPRTAGELLAGPVAPEQGRTAIIAWHDDHIVTVPEAPGSQVGADVQMRVVDISDPANPIVTILPAHATGFHAHAYFHYGEYLYVGPHCLDSALQPCNGSENIYRDSLRIGGPGQTIGTSNLTRASMETDAGLAVGGINRSGTQSPWGAEDFWTYNPVGGDSFLAVRRNPGDWIYDWGNGGAATGPAILSTWDHLGDTGVIGFPFIMGNILVYAADMTGTGVCTYDISDPANPVLLDVLKEENPGGYWPEVYGHYVFFPRRDNEGGAGSEAGFMVVDFSDPTDLRVVADRNLEGSNQYVTFQDEYAFMNRYKIDMRTFDVELELVTTPGVVDASQFALPVGNLVVTGGYGTDGPGLAIWAHQNAPDTRSPFVLYHIPEPDQTNYSIYCPITLSIPETLRSETIVNGSSLIVRPVGGSPIDTWHSFGQGKLLTITPQQVLHSNTTYEVILTSDIQDAAGNGLEPYTFRFSTGGSIGGGNQPPSVDSITVNPEVAAPNTQVSISWTGSDPEAGVIEYRVDVGDGTSRTAWGTSTAFDHTYTDAGHYQITVQARDNMGSVAAGSRTITVATVPAEPNSTASSMMAIDAATEMLFVANPDTDTVSAIDTTTLAKLWEEPVGRDPRSVAPGHDGTLWVVCRDSDTISILNSASGTNIDTIGLDYGAAPIAIAPAPDGATMFVSCEGDEMLRRFSVATRTETGSVALGPSPRAIAIMHNGTRAFVTRFISPEHRGEVYNVSLGGGMALSGIIPLVRDHSADSSASSRGVPNYLAGIRISPDGQYAWVVGKKDNTTRGSYFGPTMTPGHDNSVRAQLMLINVSTGQENLSLRLDIDNSDSPAAVAFSPYGDYAFIALQGNSQIATVDVADLLRQDSPGTIHSRFQTGLAPQGVLVDGSTHRIFSADFMDRTVTSLEAGGFITAGSANVPATAIPVVENERFHDSVLRGKQIFYHASDPRMSAEGYLSCATCHLDGSHDGRTLDFTNRGEGFRNTTDLRGRSGVGHGNVHWSSNFDEIQDFENDIRTAFGGTGFLTDTQFASLSDTLGSPKAGVSVDLDALSAYVTSLGAASLPRSPHRNADGTLSTSALAGLTLFNSHNCASCHNPASDYTDRTLHDVGTLRATSGQRLGSPLTGIDTPTLLGLHASAPYFHDGSAASLEEVFTIAGGRMEQAESGILANGAYAQDVGWMPMKYWHQGHFVELDGARSVTFNDVASSIAGSGFVEVRFNSAYGNSVLSVSVNGSGYSANLPQTGNMPSWQPNEWRRVRIPVTFASGANTVVFSEGASFAQLYIDDILFSTPEDMAAANAHVRGFTAQEIQDLSAYLLSLDQTDATGPVVTVSRSETIPQDGIDDVDLAQGESEATLVYTIQNSGTGPLNLGQFSLTGSSDIQVTQYPAAHVPAGQSTQMEIRVSLSGASASTAVDGWSDSPTGSLRWSLDVTQTANVPVELDQFGVE